MTRLALAPAPAAAWVTWTLLIALPILLAWAAGTVVERAGPALPVMVAGALLPVAVLGWLALRRGFVAIEAKSIAVHAGLSSQRFAMTQIRPGSIVELPDGTADVGLRLAGVGLPGLRSGWFRSRGGKKLFLASVTEGPAVQFDLLDATQVRLGVVDAMPLLRALGRIAQEPAARTDRVLGAVGDGA